MKWYKIKGRTIWQIDGEKVETVTDFIFLGSKITVDGDCSHEIKRPLLLGRKAMTNQDSVLKSRDITLPTKILLWRQSHGFSSSHECDFATPKAYRVMAWAELLQFITFLLQLCIDISLF